MPSHLHSSEKKHATYTKLACCWHFQSPDLKHSWAIEVWCRAKKLTHGSGSERIITARLSARHDIAKGYIYLPSVRTSDQAWARYIVFVFIQFSTVEPKPCQFIHKGQHWNRFVKKKTLVQANVTIIKVQTETTKTLPLKILTRIELIYWWYDRDPKGFLPLIEKKYRYFGEAKGQGWDELWGKDNLFHLRFQYVKLMHFESTCSKTVKRWSKTGRPSPLISVCCPRLPIAVPVRFLQGQ